MTATDSTPAPPRRLSWLLALTLISLVAACSGSTPVLSPDEPTPMPSNPEPASDSATPSASTSTTNSVPSTDAVFGEVTDACGANFTTIADLWEGLDSVAGADVAVGVRKATLRLTGPNPTTCRGLEVVDLVVDAASVGAVQATSLTHGDPFIRYDLYAYASQKASSEAGAQQAIRAALQAVLPADSKLVVTTVGNGLFVASSWINTDGSDRAPRDIQRITSYYGALMSNEE